MKSIVVITEKGRKYLRPDYPIVTAERVREVLDYNPATGSFTCLNLRMEF